jgi:predicted nucleotidyltransferase
VGKIPTEITEFIKILKQDYDIEKVIFFGSRTRNDYLESSDFDLIVVSRDFEDIFFTERISKMYKYWKSPKPLEIFCYTPEEFARKSSQLCIVRKAAETGINIV